MAKTIHHDPGHTPHLPAEHAAPDWLDNSQRRYDPLGAHGTIVVPASYTGDIGDYVMSHLSREYSVNRQVTWVGQCNWQSVTLANGDREVIFEVHPRWAQDPI